MEPQAIPAELHLVAELDKLRAENASMEPQAIPAELQRHAPETRNHDLRFNGAAGDPCGVTLSYSRRFPRSTIASMEPQAIPAELLGGCDT